MLNLKIDKLIKMLEVGTNSISYESNYINNLNIFPVPDGDTGINMKLTSLGAYNKIKDINFVDLKELSDVYSKELLMNARGNSGVIFSQILKGFCDSFKKDQIELTISDLKKCFLDAKKEAYNAVFNPIEGTILTVIRIIADHIQDINYETIQDLFDDIVNVGTQALNETKNMLNELMVANVVDSGAYGLISFLKGMQSVANNTDKQYLEILIQKNNIEDVDFSSFNDKKEEIGFGYCTEVIFKLKAKINPNWKDEKKDFNKQPFIKELTKIGDSLVCVQDDDLVKVHIHTMFPYKLLRICQKYGEFEKIKIENMTNQFLEKLDNQNKNVDKEQNLKSGIGIIYTVPTEEMADIIKEQFDFNNYIIVENNSPSIQSFVDKINNCDFKKIIIITDDKNMLLAAQQAIKVCSLSKQILLIPSNNFIETINAMTEFQSNLTLKQNEKLMLKALKKSVSGLISTSVKDIKYENIEVKTGQKISIINKKIVAVDKTFKKILFKTFELLLKTNKNPDLCYLIYGNQIKKELVDEFCETILEKYGIFVEAKFGNQNIYDLFLGLM